jgi:hypothetical protein
MALGKQNRTDGKAISLKLQLKDGKSFLDCARFARQEKQSDGKYADVAYETDVNGDLIKVEPRLGEYEGKPVYSFKLGLNDPQLNETYYVDVSLGSALGRGLANSVLNLKAFENVQIGLYSQKNEETKKVYPAASIRQGDVKDTVKKKYDPKAENSEVPAPRIYEGPDGPAKDFRKQEIFFFDKLTEFAKVVEEAAKNRPKTVAAPKANEPTTEAPSSEEDDDKSVPF